MTLYACIKTIFMLCADPDAEVIALSPKTLMATNRFVCEICGKGFQRDQNLQLHRRGHNLPWKLRQRSNKEIRKRVYVCPDPSCVHHDPSRALGDLTGIKKHFCRKHGEKKWKCDKCSKRYAVQSDWKAHLKTCGTREYRCDCGTLFSRRDSFITHRAFCDALAEESARVSAHRQGGSQQPGDSDSTHAAASSTRSLSTFGAPSSPRDESLASGVFRSGMANISGLALSEGGIASLTSRWPQGSSSQPRLSLWLGSGPETGGPRREMPGSSEMGYGNASINSLDSNNRFLMQLTKCTQNGLGMTNLIGSRDFDAPNTTRPSSSMGFGFPGMPGISGVSGVMNELEHGSVTAAIPTVYTQRQHTAGAETSATALLQKAAQMGATVSNSSLFRGFGLAAGDSSIMGHGGQLQNARHDTEMTTSLLSGSLPQYYMMKHPVDLPSGDQSLGSSNGRTSKNTGMQDFMASLAGGAGLFVDGLNNLPSLLGTPVGSNNICGMMLPSSILNHHHTYSTDRQQSSQSIPVHAGSQYLSGSASHPAPGTVHRSENTGDRPTLDFLGVGEEGRTLSERDLATMTSLRVGVEVGSLRESMQAPAMAGGGGQSSGNSWDSSQAAQ
eukprot:c24696_g1_i1 orf=373-2211(-)